MYREIGCDTHRHTGCSNIFDRPLATSTEYADGLVAKYIPSQASVLDSAGAVKSHLKISRPTIGPYSGHNFCIQFDYKCRRNFLQVSFNAEADSGRIYELPLTGTKEARQVKVCASFLNPKAKDVQALYLRFGQRPILDTDDYFVQNIQMIKPSVQDNDNATRSSITSNTQFSTLHFFNIDSNVWSFPEKNSIKFFASNLDIWGSDGTDTFVAILNTKWFQVSDNGKPSELRIGFQPNGDDLKENYHNIEIDILSPGRLLLSKNISVSQGFYYI